MRRRAWPWLLLLALLLLGWWSLQDSQVGDGGGPPIEQSPAAPYAPPPLALGVPSEAEPAARLVGTGREEPAGEAESGATLRCRVLDPDGAPRPRSLVQLSREESVELISDLARRGFRFPSDVRRTLSQRRADVHGLVAFSGLPTGRYKVEALAPPGLLAPEADVDLVTADMDVDLTYRRTVTARIEVLDTEGRPVPHAGVAVERAPATGVTTDEDGVAMVEELDPDWDVGLRIRPPANSDLLSQTVDPWVVRDTRVVLEPSLAVSGRVVDEHGEPVPRARVHRSVEDGSWHVHVAGADGRFRLPGLRRGDTLTLRVGPPGSRAGALTEAVTVAAGTEDHVVVLPRGGTLEVVVPGWPADALGSIRLTPAGAAPEPRNAPVRGDGRCTFRYLDPTAVHVLWGELRGDERILYRPQVRAQEEPLEVGLQEGGAIHVRVEVPEGVALQSVQAFGPGVHRRAVLHPHEDGSFRIPPLPPGRWTVQALGSAAWSADGSGLSNLRSWRAETVAQPGAHVELTLEPGD